MSHPEQGAAGPLSAPPMLDRVLGFLSALPLALIVGLTFADVFGRYVFSAPIRGSVEIIEYAMALAIFTALPLVTRSRGHVSVSLVDGVLRGPLRRLKNLLCDALSTLALGVITWRLWVQAQDALQSGDATVVLNWPHAPLYFAMALFSAVSALAMAWLTLEGLRGTRGDA